MTSRIEFDFEAGLIENSSMQLTISNNNNEIKIKKFNKEITTVSLNITFPTTVLITVSGKSINDTVLDSSGNIIADKYLKLTDIRVDKMSVDRYYLPRFIEFETEEKKKIITNYFGFNGTIAIDFSPNPFKWLAGTKKR